MLHAFADCGHQDRPSNSTDVVLYEIYNNTQTTYTVGAYAEPESLPVVNTPWTSIGPGGHVEYQDVANCGSTNKYQISITPDKSTTRLCTPIYYQDDVMALGLDNVVQVQLMQQTTNWIPSASVAGYLISTTPGINNNYNPMEITIPFYKDGCSL